MGVAQLRAIPSLHIVAPACFTSTPLTAVSCLTACRGVMLGDVVELALEDEAGTAASADSGSSGARKRSVLKVAVSK